MQQIRIRRRPSRREGPWHEVAEGRTGRPVITRIVRRPFTSLMIAAGLMVFAAVPVLSLHIGQSGVAIPAGTQPSTQGYVAVARYFPMSSEMSSAFWLAAIASSKRRALPDVGPTAGRADPA